MAPADEERKDAFVWAPVLLLSSDYLFCGYTQALMSFLYHLLPVLGSGVVKRLDSQLSVCL